MDKFNIEQQYQFYLEKNGLSESTMPAIQNTVMRNTFFGAFGIMMVLLQEDIPALSDDEAFSALDGMIEQVTNHFLKATGQQN
jgi:hypothetical protein